MLIPALTGSAPQSDIATTAAAAGGFKTVLAAATAVGLAETLRDDGPWTVFAPRDSAFDGLDLDALLADQEALTQVLERHIVPGILSATDLLWHEQVKALDGTVLAVRIVDGRLTVNGAAVLATDIGASNGTIHALGSIIGLEASSAERSTAAAAINRFGKSQSDSTRRLRSDVAAGLRRVLKSAGTSRDTYVSAATEAAQQLGTDRMAARLNAIAESDQEVDALDRQLEQAVDDLTFSPYLEAELPVGFPPPAPTDEIVVKEYPVYRMAKTDMSGRGGMTTPFFKLFNHIKREDIAMTAPVQVDYTGEDRSRTMAFLYRNPDMGDSGTDPESDGQVEVVDSAATLTVSIGVRGYERPQKVDEARDQLESWLKANADRFERAGPLRTMGYNSPMVPAKRRYFEVEIPIRSI